MTRISDLLFVSELYAQLPDFQQISLLEPVLTNTTIQATIFNIGGVPIINALPLIKQYWLNNQAGEPVHMFTDMNAILVWWYDAEFFSILIANFTLMLQASFSSSW
ncbi:hypothetical protein [Lacticaseibacillus paracasei]|uniref:hypothetical protein n=1 Tax=Lacticaseibacillus paracasei TaxID=1597 RepID=UPI002480BEE1|nr:hypothetical protein [Lacticaseibacillus paracasei]